ncbi:YsnF/AvaK domain-containing protein [Noviherbaspirillum sp.]|uniref:YsnF/AvaK domain-containing protein n=1 Tax=Noviherbaspirillum sp. TaxID=1926288 RepID=UPI002FE15262
MAHTSDRGSAFQPGNAPAAALKNARIVDAGGRQASIVSLDQGTPGTSDTLAWVQVADGPQIQVPVSLLELQQDGTYRLPFAFDAVDVVDDMQLTFPVMEEQLRVGKRSVDTGAGVRIHKTVSERQQVIDEALFDDELAVERIPMDEIISGSSMPETRYEGSTLIVPVLEEVLVVEKKLRLKEEVRITRLRRETHAPQTVTLRSEEIDVERFDDSKPRQA